MKKRSLWSYAIGGFFDFFDSTSTVYATIGTLAALTVVALLMPYVTLGLFGLAVITGIGMVGYDAVIKRRQDNDFFELDKENKAFEQRQRFANQARLNLMLSLADEIQSADRQAAEVYSTFAKLMESADELLNTSGAHEQAQLLAILRDVFGHKGQSVIDDLNDDNPQPEAITRIEAINYQLIQALRHHVSAQMPIQDTKECLASLPEEAIERKPSSFGQSAVHRTIITSQQTTLLGRKQAISAGIKTTLGALALFATATSMAVAIVFPPAILPALVLPLVAVGVTALAVSLCLGAAAAYYHLRVLQPARRRQQKIQQQHEAYQRRHVLFPKGNDSLLQNALEKAPEPSTLLPIKQAALRGFKHISQHLTKVVNVDTSRDTQALQYNALSFSQVTSSTNHEIAAKPRALTPETSRLITSTSPSLLSIAHKKRSWYHYLGEGLFQFVDKASTYYGSLSVVGLVIAGVVTSVVAPYVMLGALGLSLVAAAGSVTYFAVKARQADKVLDTMVYAHQDMMLRQQQLQHAIQMQRLQHRNTLTQTHHQHDSAINAMTELGLLVRALEDFLRTQTHAQRLQSLTLLNSTLGENWQQLRHAVKQQTQDETTLAKVVNANHSIKAFLDGHVSRDMKAAYLSRHPRLQVFMQDSPSDVSTQAPEIPDQPLRQHAAMQQETRISTLTPKPVFSRSSAAKTGFKAGFGSLTLLVAGACAVVSIIFPPAIIPTIVLPLVGLGVGLLISSIAVGVAAAFYDYRVAQPKAQASKWIQDEHRQYEALAPTLDNLEKKRQREAQRFEKEEVQDSINQEDRLAAAKTSAKDAIKRLSLDFESMTTDLKGHFIGKKIVPNFDFLLKPQPTFVAKQRLGKEEKPLPAFSVA